MKEEEEKEEERKLPEFIIIEEEEQEYYEEPSFSKFQEKAPQQTSWKVRLLFFFAGMLACFWAVGAFFLTLLVGTLTLLTFMKVPVLKTVTNLYWSWAKGGTVVALGLIVGIFNLPLGLMIIVFYFSQTKDQWQRKMAQKMVYPHMKDYF